MVLRQQLDTNGAVITTMMLSCEQFAAQANRQQANAMDLLETLAYQGVPLHELAQYSASRRAADAQDIQALRLRSDRPVRRTWAHQAADLLPSDDESDTKETGAPAKLKSLRAPRSHAAWDALMGDIIPNHLPQQPPKHCWMFTPVFTNQMLAELPATQLVNRKLDNTRLVESALRKLIRDTDTAALPESERNAARTETPAPADASAMDVVKADEDTEAPNEQALRPRPVNYKASWYAASTSRTSGLPSTNLYAAKLRGDAMRAKRPRRYIV